MIRGQFDYTEETMINDIYQLRGGNNLIFDIDSNSIKIEKYYDLSNVKTLGKDEITFEEAAIGFREKFMNSVELRLRSDVTLGYCLSGGLDSSAIVCAADKIIKSGNLDIEQNAVSSCFHEKEYDEQEYIDEVIRIFKSKNYKNLELAGFYWVAEEATHSRTIIHQVGDHMRSLGYKFYWIPYWGSDGHGEWKELKFDIAYQQPNYFFYQQKPDSVHLPKVCEFAKERGMYLEVEFDERALKSNPDYRADRLHDYMDAFHRFTFFSGHDRQQLRCGMADRIVDGFEAVQVK